MKTINERLNDFNIDNLDMFERMQYDHFIKSISKAEALQVLINSVEGDTTQLSKHLAYIAERQIKYYSLEETESNIFLNQ
jgi:hypothetical protein